MFVLRDEVIGHCSKLGDARDTSGGRELTCNFFRPEEVPKEGHCFPCVVVIYGGGWVWGDKGQLEHYCTALAENGFAAVACEYRLSQEAAWPGMINDVKLAIRWARANAQDLHVDPERIGAYFLASQISSDWPTYVSGGQALSAGVFGGSAGGHLASLCAGNHPEMTHLEGDGGFNEVPSTVKAAVVLYPWTTGDLKNPNEVMQGKFDEILSGLGVMPIPPEFCPVNHVCPGSAPVAFIHGTRDPTNPHEHSVKMHQALQEAGVSSELHLVADVGAIHIHHVRTSHSFACIFMHSTNPLTNTRCICLGHAFEAEDFGDKVWHKEFQANVISTMCLFFKRYL